MSEYTKLPWDQTVDAVVEYDNGNVIASIRESDFSGAVDDANLRRIVAAVNATKDFTTEGLEEIAAKGLTERMALLASLMMNEIKAKAQAEHVIGRHAHAWIEGLCSLGPDEQKVLLDPAQQKAKEAFDMGRRGLRALKEKVTP